MTRPFSADEGGTQPKRRWHQYTLRTLLLVMFLASIGLSWFDARKRLGGRQREAVAALRRTGAHISYEYEKYNLGSPSDQPLPGPAWRRILFGVDSVSSVRAVEFADGLLPVTFSVSEDDLRPVRELTRLRYYTPPLCVTDAGLAALQA